MVLQATSQPPTLLRTKPIGFWTGGAQAVVDNNWKIVRNPGKGQCDGQAPYYAGPSPWKNMSKVTFLFDLDADYHELHDLSASEPEEFKRMSTLLEDFIASVQNSQANETKCGKYGPPTPEPAPTPAPGPAPAPRTDCKWATNTGQNGTDLYARNVSSKEECCAICWAEARCKAADFHGHTCHIKDADAPKPRNDGSVSCVPMKDRTEAEIHWAQFD